MQWTPAIGPFALEEFTDVIQKKRKEKKVHSGVQV